MEISEKIAHEIDYPTNLDVVLWKDKHYQVAATARFGDPQKDIFYLNPLVENPKTLKVSDGAIFTRFDKSQDLPEGYIYRKDEYIRVTGEIVGGKKEE